MGFKKIKFWIKIQILDQNPKVLALCFTKKRQFSAKTDRKFIFLSRGPLILDHLYIMVMYVSFYGF
jgi:hypothetical protein